MSRSIIVAAILIMATGGALYARSAAALFDALVPFDRGVSRILSDVSYGGDKRQKLDVYAPDAPTGPLPILVFFYGGAWNDGSKDNYAFAGSAFASRDFVVVVADYRLHPQVVFPGFLEDCAAAVAWARAHADAIGGDADRIVLAGHSAGAYNAAMLALDPQWLRRAGVPQASVRAWAGLSGPYDFLPLDDPATIRTFSHVQKLALTQPGNFAAKGAPPAFLATGAEDTTVAPRHTLELARRLRAASVAAETRQYSGIGHAGLVAALAWPLRWRAPVLEDAVEFLRAAVRK